jgi:hypothetical protein
MAAAKKSALKVPDGKKLTPKEKEKTMMSLINKLRERQRKQKGSSPWVKTMLPQVWWQADGGNNPKGNLKIKLKPIKPEKPRIKTLDDLRQIKELKDQIEALKARITRKDATIKSLKRRMEKLKHTIDAPEKEVQRKIEFLVENPDFLEL